MVVVQVSSDVGWSSNQPPQCVVLASRDPVALDYHASKYILYPNSGIEHHNPEYEAGAFHQYLKEFADCGGGVIDERNVRITSYDFKRGDIQKDHALVVSGERTWGHDPRTILKYLYTVLFCEANKVKQCAA